jgi:uncharacterized protein (TIGR04168 family)
MSQATPAEPGGAIAVVGDLHSSWELEDLGYFNRSDYETILVTGDLGRTRSQDGRRVARSLTHLMPEVLVMPGNNDVEEYPHIRAELTYRRARADLLADTLSYADSEPPVSEHARLCGYSLHPLRLNGLEVSIVAGRPFSMGGPELSFPEALERLYQVRSLAESSERMCALVDSVSTRHVVFFAHNGPTGFGGRPDDIWGRDFDPAAGDWGDADLRTAIEHARGRGLRVLAVVAGHMHWSLRGDPARERRWQLQDRGTLYLNAARVPRVFEHDGHTVRQHIRLQLTATGASAEERLIPDGPDTSGTPD